MDEKSYKSILIYHIRYMTVKVHSYAAIIIVNPLYFIIDKTNGYVGGNNGNKYLTLVPTDKSKDTLKKFEKLRDKIGERSY